MPDEDEALAASALADLCHGAAPPASRADPAPNAHGFHSRAPYVGLDSSTRPPIRHNEQHLYPTPVGWAAGPAHAEFQNGAHQPLRSDDLAQPQAYAPAQYVACYPSQQLVTFSQQPEVARWPQNVQMQVYTDAHARAHHAYPFVLAQGQHMGSQHALLDPSLAQTSHGQASEPMGAPGAPHQHAAQRQMAQQNKQQAFSCAPAGRVTGKRARSVVQPEQAAQLEVAAKQLRNLPQPVARYRLAELTGLPIGHVDNWMLNKAAAASTAAVAAAAAAGGVPQFSPCQPAVRADAGVGMLTSPPRLSSPPETPPAAVIGGPTGAARMPARHQQLLLAMAFARDPNPPLHEKQELAALTDMSIDEVEHWLSSRRTLKSKLQSKIDEQKQGKLASGGAPSNPAEARGSASGLSSGAPNAALGKQPQQQQPVQGQQQWQQHHQVVTPPESPLHYLQIPATVQWAPPAQVPPWATQLPVPSQLPQLQQQPTAVQGPMLYAQGPYVGCFAPTQVPAFYAN